MKVLLVSGILVALTISLFVSSSVHQGLTHRTYPNPPHAVFDQDPQNYTRMEHLIQKKYENIDDPESIEIASNGDIYSALRNGQVIRIDVSTGLTNIVASLPGRGLGLALSHDEKGIVVDVQLIRWR